MKLVIIFGPSAVGKTTVGTQLAKETGMKLLHNHISIEIAIQFFDYGTDEFHELNDNMRKAVFRSVAKSQLEGLIFTFVWALDLEEEYNYIEELIKPFQEVNADIFYVELYADQETRLERNIHPQRLALKPSKRNIESSKKDIINSSKKYRLNTNKKDRKYFEEMNYVRIDNSNLDPKDVVEKIRNEFDF
jgi:hypothetical protein